MLLKNKKCANRSQRTEKRKLRLSLNKLKELRYDHNHFVEFALLPNSKIVMAKKRYNNSVKRKNTANSSYSVC